MTEALTTEDDRTFYVKKPIPIRAVQLTQAIVDAFCFDEGKLPDGVRFCSSSLYPPERKIRSLSGLLDSRPWCARGVLASAGRRLPCHVRTRLLHLQERPDHSAVLLTMRRSRCAR